MTQNANTTQQLLWWHRYIYNLIIIMKNYTTKDPTIYFPSNVYMNNEKNMFIYPLRRYSSFSYLPHWLLVVVILFFFLGCGKFCISGSSFLRCSFCGSVHFFIGFLLLGGCHFLQFVFGDDVWYYFLICLFSCGRIFWPVCDIWIVRVSLRFFNIFRRFILLFLLFSTFGFSRSIFLLFSITTQLPVFLVCNLNSFQI